MASSEFNLTISHEEKVKPGFSIREETFFNMQPELLYMYATFYIHFFREQKIDEVNDLKDALKDLDDTWVIAGDDNEHLKEEGYTECLFSKFFNAVRKGEIMIELNEKYFDYVSKLNLQQKYIKLQNCATEEKFNDLFLGILPTAHKLGQLQSQKIGIDYTIKDKIITIGYLVLIIAAFYTPVPIPVAVAVATSILAALLRGNLLRRYLIHAYKEIFRDFEVKKSIITILLEEFNINPEKQHLYFQEKGIATNQKLEYIYSHNDEEIIEKWNEIFDNSFHFKNIQKNDKRKYLIKIIRSIKINFRIKDILLKDHSDQTVNASQSVQTKELKSFKIDEQAPPEHNFKKEINILLLGETGVGKRLV
jgi:hypothetical protein